MLKVTIVGTQLRFHQQMKFTSSFLTLQFLRLHYRIDKLNFQNNDLLYHVVILNLRGISRYSTVFLHLFQGPYPRPTLSPALTAATLPTPVTERLDATGTLPPVTTPAKTPTTTPSSEEATTVVCSLLCLTFQQKFTRPISQSQCVNCVGDK